MPQWNPDAMIIGGVTGLITIVLWQLFIPNVRYATLRRRFIELQGRLRDVQGWHCDQDHPHALYEVPRGDVGSVWLCLTPDLIQGVARTLSGHRDPTTGLHPYETFGDFDQGTIFYWGGAFAGFTVYVKHPRGEGLIVQHRCGDTWHLPDGAHLGDIALDAVSKHRVEGCSRQ